ncbi:MAG: DNA-3-methyladenine glycosylase I [Planctomycetota bacterium]|jgi:DNA-3-methyladenine glycosylase I|nr:DNA-3-methyladenine glycosylase I [Planctomycetota bacterium]
MKKERERCPWCLGDPLYRLYHDREWGVPVHDDRKLFEFLLLEGAQAGLSWLGILRKRENYRSAFAGFRPEEISGFDSRKISLLLSNPGIVRNRLKIASAIGNARLFLEVAAKYGSFAKFIWGFVDGRPIRNSWRRLADIPPVTPLSIRISKEMKKLGFKFVGPTIIYSHMQATGMVNDHLLSCFRHAEV